MAQIVQQAPRLGVVAQAGQQQDVADPPIGSPAVVAMVPIRASTSASRDNTGPWAWSTTAPMVRASCKAARMPAASAASPAITGGLQRQKPGRGSDRLTARDRLTVHIRFGHSRA